MEAVYSAKRVEENLKLEESKRRKREGLVILVTALMVLAFAYFEVNLPDASTENPLGSNIVFFLLINVNIILLILLVFLVVRSLVKLLFERRRGILGSRLRVRLVMAFVGLSLVPTLIMFFIAGGFVTRSFERWFDVQVESALQGSLEIGQTYYQNSANTALFYAKQLSRLISDEGLFDPRRLPELKDLIERKQREYNLGTVELFTADRRLLVVGFNHDVPTGVTIKADSEFLNGALRGLEVTRTQEFGEGDVIRGGAPIYGEGKRIRGAVVVDYYVPKSIAKRAAQISRSYEQYKHSMFLKTPMKNSYILTLLLITLVIIFAATWFGLYLAKGITVPIQQLAEGTHAVAQRNWDYRIEASRDDEIGTLVESFNGMTRELKSMTGEIERRGRYMETLLVNVQAGVIAVDAAGKITAWNKAAERMFGMSGADTVGRPQGEIFVAEHLKPMREMMERARDGESLERELRISLPDRILTVVANAATLRDDEGHSLGVMVFVDDITEIQKVQRMEAWREVARRIAHEIKNPLTPIQLSAERLRKRYAQLLEGDGAVLDKCTTTIIRQVEELKNLVNEFAQFARLPAAELARNDLNEVVGEALFLYQEGHRDIHFEFRPGVIPALELDRNQIKRALINLLDNAVTAMDGKGQVEIATSYDRALTKVCLEVADNGRGLPPDVRTRIFEPYFSTKQDGTGLGLSIVNAIVEDHHGYIRVRPNEPRGTKFIIELPVRQQLAA
jgi:two-component system nitrogen regulation sensor histidine kinase NtrY